MPTVTIRQLSNEEAPEVLYPLAAYSFGSSPPLRDRNEYVEFLRLRRGAFFVAAFEDDKPVAVVASTAMTQNLRGKLLSAGGVWGVASHPAARRNGYVRGALTELLALMRSANQAASSLYPFRESFYERLGYTNLPRTHTARIPISALTPLLKRDLGGHVELCSVAEGYDAYRDYLLRVRTRTHGMAVFDYAEGEKEAALKRNDFWIALAKAGSEVVGAMIYNLRSDGGEITLHARRFYYDAVQGRYLLLQWIARHVDQAQRTELWLHPSELPETWLPDLQVGIECARGGPMARVVDVMGLAGLSVGEGGLAVRLADPICRWNEGCWRFEADGGVLHVAPSEDADCELTIQGLNGLVFGGHDPANFTIRGWGEPMPAAQLALRRLFPPAMPYMHETF